MRAILSLLCFATACASTTTRTTYTFELQSVSAPGEIDKLAYRGELLAAEWKIDTASIAVDLVNRSKQPITFRWSETSFHDTAHLPKQLTAGSTVSLALHPLDRTHHETAHCFKATKYDCTPGYVDARYRYHYPRCASAGANLKECALVRVRDPLFDKPLAIGEKMTVELPVSVGEEQLQYAFVFSVTEVKTEKVEKPKDDETKVIVGACPCPKRFRKDEP